MHSFYIMAYCKGVILPSDTWAHNIANDSVLSASNVLSPRKHIILGFSPAVSSVQANPCTHGADCRIGV